MRLDLEKLLRIYSGTEVEIFTVNRDGGRCPDCTDTLTGHKVCDTCITCLGTGFIKAYTSLGNFKVLTNISPKVKTSSPVGDSEGMGRRDTFVLVGVPLLQDQDLIVTLDTGRVYKVVDEEPTIAAIGGEIIVQVTPVAPLSKGAPEYVAVT